MTKRTGILVNTVILIDNPLTPKKLATLLFPERLKATHVSITSLGPSALIIGSATITSCMHFACPLTVLLKEQASSIPTDVLHISGTTEKEQPYIPPTLSIQLEDFSNMNEMIYQRNYNLGIFLWSR